MSVPKQNRQGSHPGGPYILSYKHILKGANSLVIKEMQIRTKRYKVTTIKNCKIPHVVKGQEKWSLTYFGGKKASWCKISFLERG